MSYKKDNVILHSLPEGVESIFLASGWEKIEEKEMSKKEIMAKLNARGIVYDIKDTKEQLLELLNLDDSEFEVVDEDQV